MPAGIPYAASKAAAAVTGNTSGITARSSLPGCICRNNPPRAAPIILLIVSMTLSSLNLQFGMQNRINNSYQNPIVLILPPLPHFGLSLFRRSFCLLLAESLQGSAESGFFWKKPQIRFFRKVRPCRCVSSDNSVLSTANRLLTFNCRFSCDPLPPSAALKYARKQ